MESNTKKYLLIGIALVCTHALAFATGRYMTPEKIIETEKIKVVEVEKQIVVVQEKIKIERVIVQNEEQRIHREEHETKHPNGLVETFKTETINIDKVVKENDIQYVDRLVEKETIKYQDRIVEKEKIVEAKKPDWRIGPMVGYNVGNFDRDNVLQGLSYGASIERRIIGPITVGVWGLSNLNFGLTVGLEF